MTQINKLKVTTCNLCNFAEPPFAFYEMDNIYDAKQWAQKTNWLSKTLISLDSDVIAFQEVFSIEALRSLTLALGYPYFEYNQQPTIEADYIYSNPALAFASKHPLKRHPNLIMSELFSGDYSRPPLHVTLMAEGLGEIDLVNVHLKSKRVILGEPDENDDEVTLWLDELHGAALSQQLRQQEALSLHRAIVGIKRSSQHPVILLGDFNNVLSASEFDPFHSRHRQRRKESRYFISPYHFYDTWKLVRHGEPIRPQDQIKAPVTHYYGEKGNRIDHILVSSEFAPEYDHSLYELTEYTITDKHIVDPRFGIDDVASDHALVSITFESRH